MARVRTFLAIDLGEKIRDRLASMQEDLALEAPDFQWVEPKSMHLTLLFLGELDHRDVLDICRSAQKAIRDMPSFVLSLEGTGCFPNMRRPRVLWVGVGRGSEEVCAIHDAIEAPLLDLGCYRREARSYTPHVTLGRTRSESPSDALIKALATYKTWSAGESLVREVLIMRSEISAGSPLYTVMGRAKLES